MNVPDDDLRVVMGLELALLDPGVLRTPERVRALLHPRFVEFGASGRQWDRESIVRALSAEAADEPALTAFDMRADHLAPGVVLVTYTGVAGGRSTLRSSVWRRSERLIVAPLLPSGNALPGRPRRRLMQPDAGLGSPDK